ncbi:hypothetical protein GCM10007897_17910 [Sphingobium jiangsuense]|uniref:Uncharacterized protein n=1 Tax=Sphingobium jiangsuense TaxID=870476 RepID=A0A7W6BN34_9SPHN|nr:hypothetical protein [Sphingobium jiangsuense]MBB3924744.1 hypothetical protein [Sphingobium jiangsuense]GLT00405.1 hypothetical protein GCM10007897_17910 [Sphingobium jiangsuense]
MRGEIWSIVIIGGPILLALVLLYALLRNRTQRNQPPMDVTERGTRELREQLDRDDKQGGS